MKKIAVVLMAILVLMVLASGCISNSSNNSELNTSGGSNMKNNSDIIVQINSDSSWSGILTYNNGTQAIKGERSASYNLGQNPGSVNLILRKTGNAGTLKVQLIKDGNVVVNQSTSGGQGVISINYSS
jgi:hypothetical protein